MLFRSNQGIKFENEPKGGVYQGSYFLRGVRKAEHTMQPTDQRGQRVEIDVELKKFCVLDGTSPQTNPAMLLN